MSRYQWDDLRYFLAVAEHGSTGAAGRALQVDASTVQRRLAALEAALGQPLALREPAGYRLTPFGMQLLPLAQAVRQAADALAQAAAGAALDLTGVVRMTCPEPIVSRLAASALFERFRARYPGLRVEFVISDRYLDLTRGDADLALRSGDTDDGRLVGRAVADSSWAVYASRRYAAEHGLPQDEPALAAHDIVAFDETLARHRASQWLREVAPTARVVARNNSVLGLLQAVRSGLGVAALPTALGDAEPELVRAFGPVPALARRWHVLARPDLRRTPRVAALFDFIVENAEALAPVLTGP